MRSILVKLHRWLGLCCGVVVFLVCSTGCLLVFEDDISAYLDRSFTEESGGTLSLEEFRRSIQEQLGAGARLQRLYLPPGRVKVAGEGGTRILYFSPRDGRYLGAGNEFMAAVVRFHRTLFLSDWGRWITLTSCLVFLLTLLAGLKLWLPGSKNWSQALRLKRDGSRRRLILDAHRVLGAYVLLPLLLIGATGLNYSKANGLLRRALFTLARETPIAEPRAARESGLPPLSLDQIVALASKVFPEAALSCLEFGPGPEDAVKVRFRHPGQPCDFGQSNVLVHPRTGEILRALNAMELPPAQRLVYVWALPLHRGQAFGRAQQAIWVVVALVGASLPWTGLWLWYSRRRKKEERRDRSA